MWRVRALGPAINLWDTQTARSGDGFKNTRLQGQEGQSSFVLVSARGLEEEAKTKMLTKRGPAKSSRTPDGPHQAQGCCEQHLLLNNDAMLTQDLRESASFPAEPH